MPTSPFSGGLGAPHEAVIAGPCPAAVDTCSYTFAVSLGATMSASGMAQPAALAIAPTSCGSVVTTIAGTPALRQARA